MSDSDGILVEPTVFDLQTAISPRIVRFRPKAATQDVARNADISVRFSLAMDRASTKKALKVTVDGKAVGGAIRFAEGDTVLVFDPSKTLPYDARVVATVAASARSADGAPLAAARHAAFRTLSKPVPKPKPATTSSGGGGSSGGSAAAGGGAAVPSAPAAGRRSSATTSD